MELNEAVRKINHCIRNLYSNDIDLFERNNYEVTISAKLAQYLFIEFKEYDVDCEYDKHIDNSKQLNELERNIRPDIIIHKRGIDTENLVCIEIKKSNSDNAEDIYKLKALTNRTGDYKYKLGIFILLTKNRAKQKIVYYENGDESLNNSKFGIMD
ncbi:MAG: hypothetical protein JST15_11105 [Bacteroidetes bacterium]|nr:hypothetical protein [Bacteroidota bacterium]